MSAGKGEEGRTWSCCAVEATAVLPQTHQQCQVVEVWEEGGVWQHQGWVLQMVWGGGGAVMGCIEEGEENITCIPSHFTCIRHSENGVVSISAKSHDKSVLCRSMACRLV